MVEIYGLRKHQRREHDEISERIIEQHHFESAEARILFSLCHEEEALAKRFLRNAEEIFGLLKGFPDKQLLEIKSGHEAARAFTESAIPVVQHCNFGTRPFRKREITNWHRAGKNTGSWTTDSIFRG